MSFFVIDFVILLLVPSLFDSHQISVFRVRVITISLCAGTTVVVPQLCLMAAWHQPANPASVIGWMQMVHQGLSITHCKSLGVSSGVCPSGRHNPYGYIQ